jgi:hypothetical protein
VARRDRTRTYDKTVNVRVRQLDPLTHQHQPDTVKGQHTLLLAALDLDKAHTQSGDRLTDRLGIRRIVLLPLLFGKERQPSCPDHPSLSDHCPLRINAVDLKDRFTEI